MEENQVQEPQQEVQEVQESVSRMEAEGSPHDNIPQPEEGVKEIVIRDSISDEERNEILSRLGRPADPDGYDLSDIVPENYNKDLISEFKKKAHENGMTAEGVRKMAEWYKNVEMQQLQAIEKSRQIQSEQHLLELKKEFGSGFDEAVNVAKRAVAAYGDESLKEYLNKTGLGDHPALVKAFYKIGREMSEDKLVRSENSPARASDDYSWRADVDRLWSDKDFVARYRRGDPQAVRKMNEAYRLNNK